MIKDQFVSLLSKIQAEERQVFEDGQREYAHDDKNVFANFDAAAEDLGGDRINDLMHHAIKHWRGICSYAKGHKSQREDIRGRIKDMRLYLALLWGMIEENEAKEKSDIGYADTVTQVTSPYWRDPILEGTVPPLGGNIKETYLPMRGQESIFGNDPNCFSKDDGKGEKETQTKDSLTLRGIVDFIFKHPTFADLVSDAGGGIPGASGILEAEILGSAIYKWIANGCHTAKG